MDARLASQVTNARRFIRLERTRNKFAWVLTIIMLVIYYGFILLVAFAPGLMATPVIGQISLGFPLGLAVILVAIILTGIYVWRANSEFDDLTQRIVESVQ